MVLCLLMASVFLSFSIVKIRESRLVLVCLFFLLVELIPRNLRVSSIDIPDFYQDIFKLCVVVTASRDGLAHQINVVIVAPVRF